MNEKLIRLTCPKTEVDQIPLVHAAIQKWAESPELAQLVRCFGEQIPKNLNLKELVEWLLMFSDNWDYRRLQQEAAAKDIGEGARWLLNSSHLAQDQLSQIEKSAEILGLLGVSEPANDTYDYVLVLGGARLSCLLRPRLAFELIADKKIKTNHIFLLASSRPVSDSERDATNTYAPEAITEFDLINVGTEVAFNLSKDFSEKRHDDPDSINRSWIIREYEKTLSHPPIVSISAPSSDPEKRRANSADTYEFFFSKFNVPHGSSLLLVTSQIYVPYQQLEAIRTLALPHKVTVETVGFPPVWGGELQGMVGPTNYLQEIRSTIQSMKRFIDSFPC